MSKARQEKAQRDEESRPAPLLYEEKTMREKLKKLFAYYNPYKPVSYTHLIDPAKFFKQYGLSLHDRHSGMGADVAKSEHRAPVGDDGYRV